MGCEIKFRAWDKEKHEMRQIAEIYFMPNNYISFLGLRDGEHLEQAGFNQVELLQYTGLKDKNGVEIYEGDVIKVTDSDGDVTPYTFKVKYIDGAFWFDCTPLGWDFDLTSFGSIDQIGYISYEVIGNIYENPELIPG